MIIRYSRKQLTDIWSQENKFRIWLRIEILICEALKIEGKIPAKSLQNIKKKANFDIRKINKIEEKVKHDVIAFLTNVAENVGTDSRYIHQGVTSSDILDTTLSYQLKESVKILKKKPILILEK